MSDRVRHDFDDLNNNRHPRNTVAEIVAYLSGDYPDGHSGISWVPYEFEDL